MKWVFTILVALNLIVFGSMVARTLVLEATNDIVNQKIDEQSKIIEEFATQQEKIRQEKLKQEQQLIEQEKKRLEQEKQEKERLAEEKRKEEIRLAEKKRKTANSTKIKDSPSNKVETENKSEVKNCAASIVLPEDAYHRIKGLLNPWPHAAYRDVAKNPDVGKATKIAGDYWVVVSSTSSNKEEMIFNLLAKGYKPEEREGRIFIARFDDRISATKLSQKLNESGFLSPVIEKKPETTVQPALSITVYKVVFAKLSKTNENKLAEILKPYGKLSRSTCQ